MNQNDKEVQLNIRTYRNEDDLNRELAYKEALNRVVRKATS